MKCQNLFHNKSLFVLLKIWQVYIPQIPQFPNFHKVSLVPQVPLSEPKVCGLSSPRPESAALSGNVRL